jgi:hypothetical protein
MKGSEIMTIRSKEEIILETVASCIVSILTDTFTRSEANTILEMVRDELHSEDNQHE